MYMELAISFITGDGKIIGRHFLSFYLFALSLINLEEGKNNASYFKLFFSITFSFQFLQRKVTSYEFH